MLRYSKILNSALLLNCATNFAFRKPQFLFNFKIVKRKQMKYYSTSTTEKKSDDSMANIPWREASSLIITSRLSLHDVVAKGRNLAAIMESATWNSSSKPNSVDYKILMVKRSGLSSFMANAFVFPGGIVEVADFSPLWWTVFEKLGFSKKELMNFCSKFGSPRPPIVTDTLTLRSKKADPNEDYIPADIALRISAIRETFEETGILLLTNPALETTQEATSHTLLAKNIDMRFWQKKVHDDPYAFLDLCLESHMCPDIWSLYEWSDWLTPTNVGHRRYDTIFYLCCLPKQPEVILDKGEVTVMKWCTSMEMLENNLTNNVFLPPPQVYELSRLLPIQTQHELREFAKKRESKGCERWMPIITPVDDGAISLLPGDDLYPSQPDYEGVKTALEFSDGLDELRAKSKNLHRLEIRGPQCTINCNVTPSCGHLMPLPHKSSQPIIQSFL